MKKLIIIDEKQKNNGFLSKIKGLLTKIVAISIFIGILYFIIMISAFLISFFLVVIGAFIIYHKFLKKK
jgi:hypothetical protein